MITLEEAREAYAQDKINLDEYKLAIDYAVESVRKPKREWRLPRVPLPQVTPFIKKWLKATTGVNAMALLISAATEIGYQHTLAHGLVMTALITLACCVGVGLFIRGCLWMDKHV